MVDWDEDGDTDLICGESDGHVHFFQNMVVSAETLNVEVSHCVIGLGIDNIHKRGDTGKCLACCPE